MVDDNADNGRFTERDGSNLLPIRKGAVVILVNKSQSVRERRYGMEDIKGDFIG